MKLIELEQPEALSNCLKLIELLTFDLLLLEKERNVDGTFDYHMNAPELLQMLINKDVHTNKIAKEKKSAFVSMLLETICQESYGKNLQPFRTNTYWLQALKCLEKLGFSVDITNLNQKKVNIKEKREEWEQGAISEEEYSNYAIRCYRERERRIIALV